MRIPRWRFARDFQIPLRNGLNNSRIINSLRQRTTIPLWGSSPNMNLPLQFICLWDREGLLQLTPGLST
uniref:Uncharacterized protein n=1 Tax=Physcomitrium patens TaxID=3218 RepID=A0A2K1IUY6_PHYPA|nr:hypothetical protein PHYPA_025036 [Physcomitrium patens]